MKENKINFLTVKEVAGILRCSVPHVYNQVNSGEIPSTKIGQAIRIPAAAFERWLARHTHTPKKAAF